jgi:hypothetical protein
MSSINLNIGGKFGLKEYVASFDDFPPENGKVFVEGNFFTYKNSEIYKLASALDGKPNVPDTALEFAITSYYTATVNIRPVQAAELLPANDKTSELRLGADTYMSMQEAKFFGRDPAPYAAALKFITDCGNIIEADIKNFMAQGIAEAVDNTFGMSDSFLMKSNTNPSSYTTRIIYNKNTGYVLNYEGYRGDTRFSDKIEAESLPDLLSAMRRNRDFDQNCIQAVQSHADMIPAIVLAKAGKTEEVIGTVKKIVANFYLNPTELNYNTLVALNQTFIAHRVGSYRDVFFDVLHSAYGEVLYSLNNTLAQKVSEDSYTKQVGLPSSFTIDLRDVALR